MPSRTPLVRRSARQTAGQHARMPNVQTNSTRRFANRRLSMPTGQATRLVAQSLLSSDALDSGIDTATENAQVHVRSVENHLRDLQSSYGDLIRNQQRIETFILGMPHTEETRMFRTQLVAGLQERISGMHSMATQWAPSSVGSSSTATYVPPSSPQALEVAVQVPYVPPLLDIHASTDASKWKINDFITVMQQDEDPPALVHDLYKQTLEDLKAVTLKENNLTANNPQTGMHTIGPCNQVHFLKQRMWARIAHVCLTRQRMGAICYGQDNSMYENTENSNLNDPEVWHLFQQAHPSTTPLMARMRHIVHDRTYDLRHKLLDFQVGMHIISSYDLDGERSILMATGHIDLHMYMPVTRHPCPFCKTLLHPDLLEFEKQVFEPGPCCISGSDLCADTEVDVAKFPCPVCASTSNVKICRLCMPQFIMSQRI